MDPVTLKPSEVKGGRPVSLNTEPLLRRSIKIAAETPSDSANFGSNMFVHGERLARWFGAPDSSHEKRIIYKALALKPAPTRETLRAWVIKHYARI